MNEQELERLAARLRAAATTFPYPPTPDVAASVRRRLESNDSRRWPKFGDFGVHNQRLARIAIMLALILAALFAIPEVRAGVIEFFQIGVVRIFLASPTPTPTPTGIPLITPQPPPTLLPSLLNLAGKTTLADARTRAGFSIPLPTYPSDLGLPDHVFLQNMGGSFVLLVWLEPEQPARIRLSLQLIAHGSFAIEKGAPKMIRMTSVHGQPAVWAEGPYVLRLTNGDLDFKRLVEGHVLIWEQDSVTYRLESDLTLEEAIKVAESLN